ncbi:hypothetical protein [Cryobacterium roopkundense]|uniref:PASTA domain-containing protein n=1 Tax=Cryobacterium roopkundense TaxID=1001240 RepID=A0A7W9E334_9MICO|nr:hypothetical protein [Cryobacterium roopkundense]MBB5639939.1 hypothetical protein [Cryobacterium roopkundense]
MKKLSMTLSSQNVALTDGTGTLAASVTNLADAAERVVLGAFPVGPPNSLSGSTGATIPDALRTIEAGATEQYTVKFDTTGATAGTYSVKIMPYGADQPPEDYAELGSVVNLVVPDTKHDGTRFPWWIVAIVAAVLIVGGGVLLAIHPWDPDSASQTSPVATGTEGPPVTAEAGGGTTTAERVPDGIVGLPLDQAASLLDSRALAYSVQQEQVAAGSVAAGTVLRVDPPEGADVTGPVLLTVAVEGPPANAPDFVLYALPECSVVPGGSLSGADQITIFVALRNSGPGPWTALVPFEITSDTGLRAAGNSALSTGSSFTPMQVDLTLLDFDRTLRFTAVADPANSIQEENEANNSLVVVVNMPPRMTEADDVPCSLG